MRVAPEHNPHFTVHQAAAYRPNGAHRDDAGERFDDGRLGSQHHGEPDGVGAARPRFKTAAEFCGEYVPLSYVVEPIIRTSSVYTLTARTGGGKTGYCVALCLAVATGRRDIIGMEVEQGRVAYLAFENPDDVRMRMMVAAYLLNIDMHEVGDAFVILDARAKPEEIATELRTMGAFTLVILDTFAAGFDGNDVNDNVQAGEYVRRLRPVTMIAGLPALVIAAHPVKNAAEDQLVPYGGGAILNEVDGNLTLAKRADGGHTVLHWQGKFRGLEFSAQHYRFEITGSPDVVDKKDRQVSLPVLRPCSVEETEDKAKAAANRDVAVLRAMEANPKATQRVWADASSLPLVSLARKLGTLERRKLVERDLAGNWILTAKGKKGLADVA